MVSRLSTILYSVPFVLSSTFIPSTVLAQNSQNNLISCISDARFSRFEGYEQGEGIVQYIERVSGKSLADYLKSDSKAIGAFDLPFLTLELLKPTLREDSLLDYLGENILPFMEVETSMIKTLENFRGEMPYGTNHRRFLADFRSCLGNYFSN